MGMEWYDMIALRNGGYKNNATYIVKGVSGEDVFEERLIKMLGNYESVLDAGCGHGEFTIKMGRYANNIIGFDNSKELIKIAGKILKESKVENISFVYAWTKDKKPLPFVDGQFDLIYSRRGPTSIIDHSRILRSGGTILGIHSGAMEKVKQKLESNNFTNIEMEVFDEATIHFPNEHEFIKYISSIP
ncbi:class I SAM-dependent methyltransferase [Clostridium sp.]|uniref:class I SAM-dependent methyltransferase n=1 Tax=Clostridium sp. TaxID=1506 RepID=UPI00284E6813|nr:class I SAM-dependent methyltransferase [Clostridium sp.]MDR3598157.1 class I SAM-dependent methyltransferase [Clostridium sp.]